MKRTDKENNSFLQAKLFYKKEYDKNRVVNSFLNTMSAETMLPDDTERVALQYSICLYNGGSTEHLCYITAIK